MPSPSEVIAESEIPPRGRQGCRRSQVMPTLRHVILMAKAGLEAYGIDAEGLPATLRVGDMHEIPYSEDFFDFVVAWNVIYHTTRDKMQAILQGIHRILRPGGLFYLTLNNTRNTHCGAGTKEQEQSLKGKIFPGSWHWFIVVVQRTIFSGQQLFVRAVLKNLPMFQKENSVGIPNGGEPVRDHK